MNSFAVDWEPDALDGLADVWLLAQDRQAVTAAQATVDRLLAQDPIGNGVHLREGLYRLLVPPLAVTYAVDEAQNLVEVSKAWYAP